LNALAALKKHLIRWDRSEQFELAAKEVLCLTPNLDWAKTHILDNVLENELSLAPEKIYRYIVFSNSNNGRDAARENAVDIIRAARKNEEMLSKNRVQIIFLTDDRTKSSEAYWSLQSHRDTENFPAVDKLVFLPIPTDIVVYRGTLRDLRKPSNKRRTFAVMSVTPFDEKAAATIGKRMIKRGGNSFGIADWVRENSQGFDVQFSNRDHYKPIEQWFRSEWNLRAPENSEPVLEVSYDD
jgi:hypothetical protein